jgi:hypothetical protein
MNIWVILIIVLILLGGGGFYGRSAGWYSGGYPYAGFGIGIGGIVLLIVVVLLLTGRL